MNSAILSDVDDNIIYFCIDTKEPSAGGGRATVLRTRKVTSSNLGTGEVKSERNYRANIYYQNLHDINIMKCVRLIGRIKRGSRGHPRKKSHAWIAV
jgi:hypothetical protein